MSARTVLELVRAATDFLNRRGVETPRLDAETLLADLLRGSRLDLYVKFDMPVESDVKDRYRERLMRRAAGEPSAYVLGKREFYGRSFVVDRRVLVPRPETELLVDVALEFLRAFRERRGPDVRPRVVELGVGSGCVLATLAAEFEGGEWFGSDVSPDAAVAARSNFETAAPGRSARIVVGDLFAPLAGSGPFDLIVSNPPYVADDEWERLPVDVRDFEPSLALRSGADPLSFLKRIVREGAPVAAENARFALEGGTGLPGFVLETSNAIPRAVARCVADHAGKPRVAVVDLDAEAEGGA